MSPSISVTTSKRQTTAIWRSGSISTYASGSKPAQNVAPVHSSFNAGYLTANQPETSRHDNSIKSYPFHLLNRTEQTPPAISIIPQSLTADPDCAYRFSRGGLFGIPLCFTYEETFDKGDTFISYRDRKLVDFVVTWPGYSKTVYPLALYKQAEESSLLGLSEFGPQLYPIERPLTTKELSSEVQSILKNWFMTHTVPGSSKSKSVPKGFRIQGEYADIRLDQILLTACGPVLDGDGSVWVAELVKCTT